MWVVRQFVALGWFKSLLNSSFAKNETLQNWLFYFHWLKLLIKKVKVINIFLNNNCSIFFLDFHHFRLLTCGIIGICQYAIHVYVLLAVFVESYLLQVLRKMVCGRQYSIIVLTVKIHRAGTSLCYWHWLPCSWCLHFKNKFVCFGAMTKCKLW